MPRGRSKPVPEICKKTGKKMFSEARADYIIEAAKIICTSIRLPKKSYWCPHCRKFHLTSKK